MKDWLPFLFVGGAVSIAVLIWLAGVRAAHRRRQALAQLAESLGFTFTPKAGSNLGSGMPTFTLFQAGRNRQVENLLAGSTESTDVMIFDWQYITGSGKSSQTHIITVVAIRSAELKLPLWLCRPESIFDCMGLTFDGRDINFEDQPLFSKKYHLHGNNEARLRRLFDTDVCGFFEQHPYSYAEASGQWLIYYRQERKMPADKIREFLADAFRLHVLLKGEPEDMDDAARESQPAVSDQARDEMPPEAERQF